jgi:hypothetical protein
VIAVTASSFREEEARARKACDGFIRKPYNRAELIAELKRFLKPVVLTRESIKADGAQVTALAGVPVSAEALALRPGLLEKLRQEERTVWPTLSKTKDMDEIEKFAGRLRAWAAEAEWSELRVYAEGLDQQVQEFDLSRLPKTLQNFPEILKSLS